MNCRPSLTDRLMYVAARVHAERIYRQFVRAGVRATAVQQRVLLAKVRRNADSDFGREHGFGQIRSVADFRRRVPLRDYEEHSPWIEQVKAGNLRALFGGRQRVLMFALSSGTTAEPKYIPVTDAFLDEYRRGWNVFGIKALLDHPEAFLRGIVQVTSRMDESHTSAGIPCGAITGLMAATQKRLVRKYYLTPRCLAEIEDPAAKYYTIMRLAVPRDAAFLITASPATQLKLARTADEHAAALIRDVHDGTLRDDLPVPPAIREQLRPRLKPDRTMAHRLEGMVHAYGRLLPRHYWNLSFLANWTGGTMGLYLRDFPEYFGDVPVRDIGLLASEGRISIPVADGTPAGVLDVLSHFYEFIPRDRIEEDQPRTCLSHELEPGQEYFVVLTTSSGLYRYQLGDLVRAIGFEGQAPIIEFLNKGTSISSMAGEKLTEHQVILAVAQATQHLLPSAQCAQDRQCEQYARSEQYVQCEQRASGFIPDSAHDHPPLAHDEYLAPVASRSSRSGPQPLSHFPTFPPSHSVSLDFVLAPRWSHPSYYILHMEASADVPADRLATALDRALCQVNLEYAAKRQSQRLGPVQVNLLPRGFMAAFDARQAERFRRGNEQYKHRYLCANPGEDAEFPLASPSI